MNKTHEPEHIANENMAEEQNLNVNPQENTVTNPSEKNQPEAEIVEDTSKLTIEDILKKLRVTVEEPFTDITRSLIESLKQDFYRLKRLEVEETRKQFLEAGGNEEEFQLEEDERETELKELLKQYREKKAALSQEEDKAKEENLKIKQGIIERIKELIESTDDFYKSYNEFRQLQQQWKEVKAVPQSEVNTLWKEYQHYSEKFYDLVKINNEMRDYDFKKNLELKQTLCESVEKLADEQDVVSAFYQLQNFHQEWREIGPVEKELREDVWQRFKEASTVINKRHQEHFEEIRTIEQRNLEEKQTFCETVETIDYEKLTSHKLWDEQSKIVLDIQEKWKGIGFAPKKHNVKVFERFRAACDVFFTRKGEFYKSQKAEAETNLEKKKVLCEKAEELKDSQDWKNATNQFVALQKEWKAIGPVPRKHTESLWKRFITACDYFFEQKKATFSSQKTEELDNLKAKEEIIAKVNSLDETLSAKEAVAQVHELMAEFNKAGFVPFKEKERIYKEYREAVNKQFDRLKVDVSQRRLESFKNNLMDMGGEGKGKGRILSERDKLMRTYERLRNDILTYENNIGFLSVSSKGGSGLVKEMQRKIESLKEELKLIEKKVEVIDDSLENNK